LSMALFADDLIRSIVRFVRREVRLRKAAKWQITEARIVRFRTMEGDFHRLRPVLDFEYEINGEMQYGSAAGFSKGSREINELGDACEQLHSLKIRRDPSDPAVNQVLNDDNPALPFAIDHDTF